MLLFASFMQVTSVEAAEGVAELGSVNGSTSRCFVMSTIVDRSNNYLLQVLCRDLIYPIEPKGLFYILWANPIALGKDIKPIRVGDIEFGRKSFNLGNEFSSLFITKEQTQSPDQPSNDKVMEGTVKSISFLDREPTPTIIPSPTIKQSPTTGPSTTITQAVTPTPQPKSGGTILNIMKILGIFILIVFILASIFYVIGKLRRS